MPHFAQATIIGHLGQAPEVRYTQSGQAVCNVSVATSRKRQDGETTTWWRCAVWGKRGEALAQYLSKGDPVLMTGEPYQREWTDNQGATRISLELDVRDWAFVGSKDDRQGQPVPLQQPAATAHQANMAMQTPAAGEFDDDIPFAPHMAGAEYCL